MVGLEDEPDVLAPELGQVLRSGARGGSAGDPHRSAGRRQHAAEDGEQRGLAAARRPHQKRQFAARDGEAHALERLHPAGADAEEFHDVDRIEYRLGHRVKTIAGSIRIT